FIEPRRFLEDIGNIVLEGVQDTIERHDCIKVNTIFNGEFATDDKRVNKSINIKNYEFFQTSNLHVLAVSTNGRCARSNKTHKMPQNLIYIIKNYIKIFYNKKSSLTKIINYTFFFRCLHYFSSNVKLEIHAIDCEKLNDCVIRLPSEDNKSLVELRQLHQEGTFIVYADLEYILEKTERDIEMSSYMYRIIGYLV
ncbi:hypothetical protein ALC53_12793, partial [Atta colombica]